MNVYRENIIWFAKNVVCLPFLLSGVEGDSILSFIPETRVLMADKEQTQ